MLRVAQAELALAVLSPALHGAVVQTRARVVPAGRELHGGAAGTDLCDMAGNLWEWVRDWYSPTFYCSAGATETDPENTAVETYRMLRGANWAYTGDYLRGSSRLGSNPEARDDNPGFRCAASLEP